MTAINSNRAIRGPVTAVPVVAGKGVRLVADTENNRIVAEADETVLWSGTRASSCTLSESAFNFEFIRFELDPNISNAPKVVHVTKPSNVMTFGYMFGLNTAMEALLCVQLTNNTSLAITSTKRILFGAFNSTTINMIAELNQDQEKNSLVKVVGINRIASN